MRRYFDNAATSHPKPPQVLAAVVQYCENIHASAGRGAYREALASERLLQRCRDALRRLFGCAPDVHVVFTLNGTDALNLALKGLLRPGDHVVTTVMDHNSVLRPLSALAAQSGVEWTTIPVHPLTTRLNPADLEQALRPETRLVALNHASNVTGVVQPLADVSEICRRRGVRLLVDAAQSAGHLPIDLGLLPVDLLACPGHKGLLGPLGTGVLLIGAEVATELRTVREGGTGSASELPVQPDLWPDRFEAGSHNAPGLAGLLAAVEWLLERGVSALRAHELELCRVLQERLSAIDGLTWYGPRDARERVGVYSIRIAGLEPAELSTLLEEQFDILSRSGLHCAPLAHTAIGTLTLGGTTRLSTGPFTTPDDIESAAIALERITRGAVLASAGN